MIAGYNIIKVVKHAPIRQYGMELHANLALIINRSSLKDNAMTVPIFLKAVSPLLP
jgi:hypothetical protein